ncbi:MAG: hypothetical protein IJX99_08765 [Clostridia bacterium]|nr:hypothetical protein [Clostridia bacterium]
MIKNIMYTWLTLVLICVIISTVGCKSGNVSVSNNSEELKTDIDTIINISQSSGENEIVSGNIISTDEIEVKKEEQFNIDEEYVYNENGRIIIVMYHKFSENENDEWTRSYDNFYQDLKYLYEHNYRSVSLNDYLNNSMKVPVGCTPIIFTFDDGSKGQFNLIRNESRRFSCQSKLSCWNNGKI